MERITDRARGAFAYAVLDFDGTLSLIREGWQSIMIPYFTEELMRAPLAGERTEAEIAGLATGFVTRLTGKQTIYQCIALADEVSRLGGKPKNPQEYKREYLRLLTNHISGRLRGLENGSVDPESMTVPGTYDMLDMLRRHSVIPYLASGTDDENVKAEARLLGLDEFFGGHIYGAQREYRTFSKKMVIERILRENRLSGDRLLGFGDGYVEIENIRECGGFAVGVASNESARRGVDEWKRERLIGAGADIIIPDYREPDELEKALFG